MITGKRLLLAILCISVTLAAVAPPTALAAGTLTLSPTSGSPYTIVTITGSGWTPNTNYYLWFDTNGDGVRGSSTTEPYRSGTTTSGGAIAASTSIRVPNNVPAGNYNFCLDLGRDGSVEGTATFTVTAAITLSPTSGNAGNVITVTGNGFAASASGNIWFDSNGDGVMDATEPQVAVTVSSAGVIPSGTTLTVPVVSPGNYNVRADIPTGDGIEASASFSYVTQMSISPTSGYAGMVLAVTGAGFIPNAAGNVWFDSNGDGVMDTTEPQAAVTVSDIGAISAGITLTVPVVSPGTYNVRADIPTGTPIEASAGFSYVTKIVISPTSGIMGTWVNITVTGGGFTPDASGNIWFDTNGNSVMDVDEPQALVTVSDLGVIPAGVILNTPMLEPNKVYYVWADIPNGAPIEASASFSTPISTTGLWVTKYDAYGNVLGDPRYISYQEMEATLPVQGNGATNYFAQGPTFDTSSFDGAWNPAETNNVDSRNYGEKAKGTDVKDLCDLVGGAAPGDLIYTKSSDGFPGVLDYESVYTPPLTMGKVVVMWYAFGDYAGSSSFSSGMRLLQFADPSTANARGQLSWGHYDMHETTPRSRWYYYSGVNPSSGGLSGKWVYKIEIRQPNLVSCDAAGNYRDSFVPGETVYVKGLALAKSTGYKLWIQDEPVTAGLYNSIDLPIAGSTYVLNAANDPSGSQEMVTTDATSGDFAPTAIWTIDPAATPNKYDIVADNQISGVGTFGTGDFIDNPGYQGFIASPLVSPVITASTGPNGSISPSGPVTVGWSASQSFTITPDTGFHIADVLVDGSSVGPIAKYYFSNVIANHAITVSFAPGSTWYLENDLTMEETAGTQSNLINLQKGATKVWLSNMPVENPLSFKPGTWIVSLRTSDWGTNGCTAQVGTSHDCVFTAFASSGTPTFSYSNGYLLVSIPTSEYEAISSGDFLALSITNNGTSTPGYRDIATDGRSFLASPASFEVTYASLGSLVEQVVTKDGIVNSLLAKLDAAEMANNENAKAGKIGAFINEVEAQAGKSMSEEDAALLIYLVKQLL